MSQKKETQQAIKKDDLREWNSINEVCSFLNVSRSFFNARLRGKIKEHIWSPKLVRFYRDDVLKLSEQIRSEGLK